ncbi:hypothetical protein ATANTOWER_014194, partial [Ataeniobius toweri]|nr:hypothetical protein [Ataeniobius toweri]
MLVCSANPKVTTNHPWMTIVHPGPWTQLPPVPPPVPLPRSKSVSNTQIQWNRPRTYPPNPFDEEEEVDEAQEKAPKHASANQTEPSAAAVHPENSDITNVEVGSRDGEKPASKSEPNTDERPKEQCPGRRFKEEHAGVEPHPAKGATADSGSDGSSEEPADSGQTGSSDVTEAAAELLFSSAQSPFLPRSLSVPAIPSQCSETNSMPSGLHEDNLSVSSCESK